MQYIKSIYTTNFNLPLSEIDFKNKKMYFEYTHDAPSGSRQCFGIDYCSSPNRTTHYYLEMYSTPAFGISISYTNDYKSFGRAWSYTSYSYTNNPGMAIDFLNNTASFYGDGKLILTITDNTYIPLKMNEFTELFAGFAGFTDKTNYNFKYFRNECTNVPDGYQTIAELICDSKVYNKEDYFYGYK